MICRLVVAVIGVAVFPAGAFALQLSPVSYSMINGRSGFNTYRDDSYGGPGATGNPNVDSSFLAGGLGQLTDGVVGTNNILDNSSFDWVGWFEVVPVITFDFGSIVQFDSLGLHAASVSAVFGDVDLPATIRWEFSSDGVAFGNGVTRTTSAAEAADPSSQWLDQAVNQSARYARAILTDGQQPWIFVSEFRFSGVPTPGAASLLAFAGAIAVRRRRG